MIKVNALTFKYKGSEEATLKDINLSVEKGGFLGIIGPAGAGKTTLGRALCGIVPHHFKGDFYGSAIIYGMDTVEHRLTDISKAVGVVFQDVESQIISSVVEDEILYGLENFGVPHEEIEERISFALKQVGIEDLRNRNIISLSGGQKQKVAIASIIALKPKILVLDEPTGELDPAASRQIFNLLKLLNEEHGITVVVIEQKIMLLCEFAKELAVLNDGKIVYHGKVKAVLENAKELEKIGVNVPRVATLSKSLQATLNKNVPMCINVDEAEAMVRGLLK
ncbi:MAG: ATP-binding cassette domain-containing protein [Clostridia bacterium]|nr:ATP-binding cassette domain-containing protein [Clostridia bacterium]